MSTAEITNRIPAATAHVGSKVIGAYYVLTILTGAIVLFVHGRLALAVDVVLGVFYLVVTALLYGLSASGYKNKSVVKD